MSAVKKMDRKYGVNFYGRANSPFAKKPSLPGQHGQNLIRRKTVFSRQRKAKQMIKAYYDLSEKQTKRIFLEGSKNKGNTATKILELLESRVKTVIYRAGFATTFIEARQLISHGHFLLNGKKITISSINLRPGDKLEISPKSTRVKAIQEAMSRIVRKESDFLQVDKEKLTVVYKNHPATIEEVPLENPLEINTLIEFYSR